MKTLDAVPNLTDEQRGVSGKVKEAVLKILPGAEVVLYGSTARGERSRDSDYDLLVITPGETDYHQQDAVYNLTFAIEMETGFMLSVNFSSRTRWEKYSFIPYYQEVRKEGIAL